MKELAEILVVVLFVAVIIVMVRGGVTLQVNDQEYRIRWFTTEKKA